LFGIALKSLKSTYSTLKAVQNKMSLFGKKLRSFFFDFFDLKKRAKTHFWEKLENEAFLKSFFWMSNLYFPTQSQTSSYMFLGEGVELRPF
jgi:hypothetical protein